MKKVLALLLAVALVLGLAACGSSGSGNPASGGNADKVYNIRMQIVVFGREFPGLSDVEAAINAITEPEIGATVTIEPVNAWDLSTTSSLQITSNEKLDLMIVLPLGSAMDALTNYTSKNMLLPLDELYAEYGKDIAANIGELEKLGYVGDTLYGISAQVKAGSGQGMAVISSRMQELGFDFQEGQAYTLDDLDPMFEAFKAKYGDGYYPIAMIADADPFHNVCAVDTLGGTTASGVLMDGGLGEMKVVNEYATQEYHDWVVRAHDYYTKGWINPDVTTISESWPTLLSAGNYLGALTGFAGDDAMDAALSWENQVGEDLTYIKLIPDFATSTAADYALFSIPVTCENPEKTMQFLNLMFQERELGNDIATLLGCGIEGKSYVVKEALGGTKAIIDYPEGVDGMSVPYTQQVPIYGHQFSIPMYAPLTADFYPLNENYNQSIADAGRYSKAFGYVFNASDYSTQISAINDVINQYRPLLSLGAASDTEKTLSDFLSALETAGINDVVAANQQQLDAWIALQ